MKITKEFIIETSGKAVISLIPVVGGPIASIVSDVTAERKQQRLDVFFLQLKEDLERLKDKINADFIGKDDFLDIFELTAKKVMEERNVIKRLAYKNILVNGITCQDSDFDDVDQCIKLVENTTENNIYLLKVLSDPTTHNNSLAIPVPRPMGNMANTTLSRVLQVLLPGWQGGLILENLKDLEFLGLILPISSSFQTMVTANGLSPVVNSLTLKGTRFVKYLIEGSTA